MLLKGGIYAHQTAEVEEEVEGDDGEVTVKRKTTGGDPDLFKFFLERAWQLVGEGQTVGMVMSSGLHQAQGSTGLRRLMLDECRLRTLVKFDNEMRVFPGVHNQFKFDLVVFDKGGSTDTFDAAFFSRESAEALQAFRDHPGALRLEPADIRRLSPQTLTFFEFKGRRDLDIVRKAYRLHPPFGQGLMPKLGLKYRTRVPHGQQHVPVPGPRLAPPPRLHPGAGRDVAGGRRRVVSERGATSSGRSPSGTPCSTARRRSTTASPGRSPRARPSAAPTSTTSRSASTSPAASASTAKAPTTAARPPSSSRPTRPGRPTPRSTSPAGSSSATSRSRPACGPATCSCR